MRRKRLPVLAVAGIVIIILLVVLIGSLIKKYTPSKDRADLNEYFALEAENDVGIIVQNEKIEAKAKLIDGTIYLDYDTVKQYLNSRFYFDTKENVLLYTLPKDVVSAEVGKKEYNISKTVNSENYSIVKTDAQTAYIAIDFIQKYTNIDYSYFENPNRVVITNIWGNISVADAKKNTQVRYRGGIKSEILTDVVKGDKLILLEDEDDWQKVLTADGFIGYIKSNALSNIREEETSREFDEPEYTSIKKDYKVNMVWHQTFTAAANDTFLSSIANTKGVNTVSPTWFSLADNDGNIKSLANESYVNYAPQLGMEVWGMVSNLVEGVDTHEVLSYTSKREKLSNQLIASAINYNLDGINVDFEELSSETGEAYIQFIRELSVKCRNNGIILSIDNYVSAPYNLFYNRKEQSVFADYLIIMGYDEHYSGSEEAGSVASIGYVSEGIKAMLEEAPAEKVILGIPFYTRLWSESPLKCSSVGMDEASRILSVNGVTPEWDSNCGQYYAQYEKDGKTYKIWLEEATSIEEKLKLMKANNLAGVAAWKLGLENSSIWDTILKYVN